MERRTISEIDWQKRCDEVQLERDQLNALVMNFLLTEGYIDAAKAFQEESGTPCGTITDSAVGRMAVRTAIEQGKVDVAIEHVNDLNPEVLDEEPRLVFLLQQQKMIELIRVGKVEEALDYAQEYLAYKSHDNHELLEDLESTVALVAFSDPGECPVGHLLGMPQRQQTASELNAAILCKMNEEKESRLATMLKVLAWAQDKLAGNVDFPHMPDSLGS